MEVISLVSRKLTAMLVGLTLGLAVSCSEEPSQYQNGAGPEPEGIPLTAGETLLPKTPTNPDGGLIDGKYYEPDQKALDEQIRASREKPIFFGQGVAGITFDTTLAQSRSLLLEEDIIIEQDPLELHVYPEGIGVQWDKVSSKKPEIITVMPTYLGPLDVPASFAATHEPIYMGSHLSEFFTDSDPEARGFFNMIYKHAMGIDESEAFDCFASGHCSVRTEKEFDLTFITLGSIGAIILSADPRKALNMILMMTNFPLLNLRDSTKAEPNEDLTTQFDLFTGKFSDVYAPETNLALGTSYQQLPEILKNGSVPKAAGERFFLPYRAGQLTFSRSHFDDSYLSPGAEERLTGVAISTSGADATDVDLVIDGEEYMMWADGEVTPTRYVPGSTKPLPLGTNFLSDGFDLDRRVKKNFLKSLNKIMQEKYQSQFAEQVAANDVTVIDPLITGIHDSEPLTQYYSVTGFLNHKTKKATLFEVQTILNDMTVVYSLQTYDHPLDYAVLNSRAQDFDVTDEKLAIGGLKIGDKIEVINIDRSLETATLVLSDETTKRVTFLPDQSTKIAAVEDTGRIREKILRYDLVSFAGLNIGMSKEGEIVLLQTTGLGSAIKGLCNEDVSVKSNNSLQQVRFGMAREDLFSNLKETTAKTCRYVTLATENANITPNAVYFPQNSIRFGFVGNALNSLTLYKVEKKKSATDIGS